MRRRHAVKVLKVVLWASALSPAAWIIAGMFLGWLGVNPIEKVTHVTGMSTLVLLLVTLAVTPFRRISGWHPVIHLRRPLGLFAFFYASVHFLIWWVLDLGLRVDWVLEDIMERPYITVGFSAFLVLIPLAVTSTKGWIRRLGRKWTTIHRGVYLAASLGAIHFYWQVKADTRLPLLLATILGVLLGARVLFWVARKWSAKASSEASSTILSPTVPVTAQAGRPE